MAQSSIEWTQMTWNPTTGCTKISAGCKFCYAEVMSKRLHAMGIEKYRNNFKLTLHPDSLLDPYSWKKPQLVFVNSMSDLFHQDVPLKFIQQVFKVMNDLPQHRFQILTKRAERLETLHRHLNWTENIWIGVSVEDERVNWRIDHLRSIDAQMKFLSLEPLIGPLKKLDLSGIHWVIVGGESGHKARPIKRKWVTEIREQCYQWCVPFFFKQWGKPVFNPNPNDPTINAVHPQHAKGGCSLDEYISHAFPEENYSEEEFTLHVHKDKLIHLPPLLIDSKSVFALM
ncbi:MAG TPA: phage Gp37/Gp68 family protein [Chitinophagales bacterium]|nr:phage Gp37/Gp68 family protein [Chitinophagales bacterium]